MGKSGFRSPHGPLIYVCTTEGGVLAAPIVCASYGVRER